MPTLELLKELPASRSDAFHDVRSPGGYEWWYFDAEDAKTDTQVVVILLHGFVFHPGYLRAYARYLRRPTRHAPPTAGDFPCAYLMVYQHGKIKHQFMTQYARDDFRASSDVPDVTMGPNTLRQDPDGALSLHLSGTPWKLTGQGPKTLHGQELLADLRFQPELGHPPDERRFLSREMTGADHHWVIANPLCRVTGTIQLNGGTGHTLHFTGRGYHDHNYGTAPIGPGLKRWIWGRVFFDDAPDASRVVTFHFARPRDTSLPDELHLTEADASRLVDHPIPVDRVHVDWSRRTTLLLTYPDRLEFGEVMTLSNPRLIDTQPFYLRLMYDAHSRGKTGVAFCEVAYPHRLRWPILGRMIEMSIDRRDRKR